MKTTIRALLCIALLATYSSCIPIGGVFRKADFGLPDKIFFPKEGGERIYFATDPIIISISNIDYKNYKEYRDEKGFFCIEYTWLTIKYKGNILIVKVEPAPDDIQRSMRIESINAYDYQVTLIYQN
ncbi:MAG: hypothetical protein SPJ99_06560 [Candidatus Coprenecus sp.]|nr:hypothetical protein [Candidatus Coprenecus sp.]